ncbi:hypothetical protein Salat_0595900 [Sesamum alatum]|uniref:Uncharacterized protein n=1 Tax=Sesamum alatum TaxID=300844 RepID=A0AAE2CTU0_9LAMI|nr:hypothetical protein Salat_0595900 [Sesamum alatum]
MWPGGYYYQQREFYCSRWSKEMERTFVHSLVDLHKARIFRRGYLNVDAICFALQDVNIKHDSKNKNLRFVIAENRIWKTTCKEKKMSKCHINAYDDMWEELCVVFSGGGEGANDGVNVAGIDLNALPVKEDSSSSLWGYTEELLGSGNDADSILPMPGVLAYV